MREGYDQEKSMARCQLESKSDKISEEQSVPCCHSHHSKCSCEDHRKDADVGETATCGCGSHHHVEQFYPEDRTIHFEGQLAVPVEVIWEMLVTKDWAHNLQFKDLKSGGQVFYQDTTNIILDFEPAHSLSWTWGRDTVTITLMALDQSLSQIDLDYWCEYVHPNTAKDLSYWLISLQNLANLAEGKEKKDWEEQYAQVLPKMQEMLQANPSIMEFDA